MPFITHIKKEVLDTSNLLFFIRGNSTTHDDSGNHATVGSGITYTDGLYSGDTEQSMVWDGVNDFVRVPYNSSFNFGDGSTDSPFSISFAVNFDAAFMGNNQRILTKRSYPAGAATNERQYNLIKNASDYMSLILQDQSTGGALVFNYETALSHSTNYHFVVAYDGSGGCKMYVNGSEVTVASSTVGSYTAMEAFTNDVYIGKAAFSNLDTLDGNLSGIGLWAEEISAEKALKIYNIQSSGKELQYLETPRYVAPRQLRYSGNSPNYVWSSGDQYRDPSYIIEFNGYYYFYASKYDATLFAGDYSEEIACFRSSTYNGAYTYQGVVLSISGSGLDDRAIFTPNVIVIDGTIYMFYTGAGTTNSERWNIFCASSTDPEGTFTRVQSTPVLYNSTDGSGDTEEDYRVDAACPMIKPDGTIRLYYKMVSGSSGLGVTGRYFGYAEESTFPTSWTKATADNPFFDSTDTPDSNTPEGPTVWYQNDKYWMVYVTDSGLNIYFASSSDGVNTWTDEFSIANTDLPLTTSGMHGACVYLENNRLRAVLFHEWDTNGDNVTDISMLTYD